MTSSTSFSKTTHIAAPPDIVWNVMVDVERWPEWTPSIKTVRKLDAGPLKVGSRARIKQPKLLPAVWTVTRFNAGHSFTWVSGVPGLHTVGYHAIKPAGDGCEVTLVVLFEGMFAGIAARVFRKLNEEYLQMEANGLKRHCETGGRAVGDAR
jgi:uncharacterized membrane protein